MSMRPAIAVRAAVTALLSSTLALAVVAAEARFAEPPAAAADPAFPATPQGRCAQAWLRLLHEGTVEEARAFEEAHRSPKALAERSIEERAARLPALQAEFRPIRVESVTQPSERRLEVAGAGPGGPVLLEFAFDADGRLETIGITSGGSAMRSQPVDAARRTALVDAFTRALREEYVLPEQGAAMADAVAKAAAAGAYDGIVDERALVDRLTADAHAVNNDRHLRVRLMPPEDESRRPQALGATDEDARRMNWGFRSCEIVEGNVGVLRLDVFVPSEEAMRVADAAMAFLARCDALIFDLRQNGGGSPVMINYLSGYLFETPTLLNRMLDRDGDVIGEAFSDEVVQGTRFAPDLPVFVVTSERTFSGAEEFSYNLQNLRRATIVGETTGGGAHPVKPVRLDERIAVIMPHLRAQNPITGTNWEGVGVQPDVPVPADKALERAIELARVAIRR